jgi:hypothetical protein
VAAIWSEVLGREIQYAGHDMNVFERQMRERMPSWMAFDIRIMFESYLERGFIASDSDIEMLTNLLGHPPRRYYDFAREIAANW